MCTYVAVLLFLPPGLADSREKTDLEDSGLYVLKKKDDELFGGVVRPKSKKHRREKRKSVVVRLRGL